ncbi:MAG: nuclear transport factor 2 family protein [Candidatus Obscuribacterales bacterium]|nr:nuclear transport factor 2 family protein [Candidatus Obscuribacterales bacterium]
MNYSIPKYSLLSLLLLAPSGIAMASEYSDVQPKKSICSVSCLEPTVDGDADSILDVLKAITRALADHDFKALASHLDANCTTYDENTRKMVVGRDNIIKDVKESIESEERRLKIPPISYVIDHPYVRVTGDQAVVTFVLIKEIGGAKPMKFESHTSDVFIKRDGQWKKLHFCGDAWKKVQDSSAPAA